MDCAIRDAVDCPLLQKPFVAELATQSKSEERCIDDGKCFGSVKPWLGNAQPPTWWDPASARQSKPDVVLDLDFVYGYRTRQARSNLHWVEEPTIFLYHAASICVVGNLVTRTQEHFLGHTDDVLCLDYNKKTRRAASGGVGANATAPLIIWSVDDLSVKQRITGILQFGVTCVCFSLDGSRVFGVGDDTNHTLCMYDVETGVCLAQASGDRNKIVHMIPDTTASRDSRRNVVTVGVSHIKFWDKTTGQETLVGKKGTGGSISQQTMLSACCTLYFVIIGNVAGELYVFSDTVLVNTIKAHSSYTGALCSFYNTVYSGGRDGALKMWSFESEQGTEVTRWDLNSHSVASAAPTVIKGVKTQRSNGPRALSVAGENMLLIGTQLGSIYTITDTVEVVPVLETHFEESSGEFGELWGMDVHPHESLFCSAGDDCTLRLWSLELGSMILMTNVTYPSRCCAFSPDGQAIALGHNNGCFSVWDSMTLVPIVPFTRKREAEVLDCSYSPDGRFLALAMESRCVDIYFVKRNYEFVGYCDNVAAHTFHLDWSLDSSMLQCCTSSYEATRFNIPQCQINMLCEGRDEVWATHHSVIGWGVQGIWEGCSDGTDVNACARSRSGKYLAVGYDSSRVRLYNYPCLPKTFENSTKVVFPKHREYTGHSSHVTQLRWSADDKYVLTSGGMDLTILRWKVVPVKGKEEGVGGEQSAGPESRDAVVQDVANGVIRELGVTSRRSVFVDEQRYVDPLPDKQSTGKDGAQTASTAAKPSRPQSSDVASRLHQTTSTLKIKTDIAKQRREHFERQNANRRRFV